MKQTEQEKQTKVEYTNKVIAWIRSEYPEANNKTLRSMLGNAYTVLLKEDKQAKNEKLKAELVKNSVEV